MIKLTPETIDYLALGADFLGTGGGGSSYLGSLMAKQILRENLELQIADISELADDANLICVGAVGSPEVAYEKLLSAQEGILAINKIQKFLGCKIDAIISAEVAGLNAFYPLCVAARMGLPVVDADGMGRAFPKLDMTTFNIYGTFLGPTALSNAKGEVILFDGVHNIANLEKYIRSLAGTMGGCVFFVGYFMNAKTAKNVSVLNSYSSAIELGKQLIEAKKKSNKKLDSICESLTQSIYGHADILFNGKIIDIKRSSSTGFTAGKAILDSLDNNSDKVELFFQNEFFLVCKNNQPIIMAPDLICLLDAETLDTIRTETLRYGQRVQIIGIRAPEVLRTPQALKIVGPKNFGLDLEYQRF